MATALVSCGAYQDEGWRGGVAGAVGRGWLRRPWPIFTQWRQAVSPDTSPDSANVVLPGYGGQRAPCGAIGAVHSLRQSKPEIHNYRRVSWRSGEWTRERITVAFRSIWKNVLNYLVSTFSFRNGHAAAVISFYYFLEFAARFWGIIDVDIITRYVFENIDEILFNGNEVFYFDFRGSHIMIKGCNARLRYFWVEQREVEKLKSVIA